MHRRTSMYGRNTIWSHNFAALCHSAMSSSTNGTGGSLWIVLRVLIARANYTAWQHVKTKYNNIYKIQNLKSNHKKKKKA